MRILLTGSTGRLGGAFLSLWGRDGSDYEPLVLKRDELDLSQPAEVKNRLNALWSDGGFDIIVNPAAVLAACPVALVGRVSWLFGPSGQASHFDQVLDRAIQKEDQHLIGDKFSVPTYTHDIVQWVEVLLENHRSGIYHLCNTGDPESWLSYAQKVCDLAQRHSGEVVRGQFQEIFITSADFFREKRRCIPPWFLLG